MAGAHNCHERLAQESLTLAGYQSAPPVLTDVDRSLFEAVEFSTSFMDKNIFALSLIIGTRSVDVENSSWISLAEVIGFHNDPAVQNKHCLRSKEQDFQKGDADAVESCKKAILDEVDMALGGADVPDFSARETVPFYLQYLGEREISVSRFYYHLGRALHAVHDSFAHSYRTEDRTGIVAVDNWIEYVTGNFAPDRDGPPHSSVADDCDNARTWNRPTMQAAIDGGGDFIEGVAGSTDGVSRDMALQAFFDKWIYHVADCTRENGWCGSPDPADLKTAKSKGILGCSAGFMADHATTAPLKPLIAIMLSMVIPLLLFRRRKR